MQFEERADCVQESHDVKRGWGVWGGGGTSAHWMSRLGALFLRPTSEFMITQEEETAKSDCGEIGAIKSLDGGNGAFYRLHSLATRNIKFNCYK